MSAAGGWKRLLPPVCSALPVLAVTALQCLVSLQQMLAGGDLSKMDDSRALCVGIALSFLISLAAVGFSRALSSWCHAPFDLGLSFRRWWPALKIGVTQGLLAVFVVMAVTQAQELLFTFLGWDFGEQQVVALFQNAALSTRVKFFLGGYAVLATPLAEEFCFRGVLHSALRKTGLRFLPAAILGGIYFSAMHLFVPALLPLTLFAILLARAYERARSVLAPVVMHALFNGTSLVLLLLSAE